MLIALDFPSTIHPVVVAAVVVCYVLCGVVVVLLWLLWCCCGCCGFVVVVVVVVVCCLLLLLLCALCCVLLCVGCCVLVVVCFHSRLTGSLVSSEGALKRFKFAAPERRMRGCPWVDHPQPLDFPVSLLECGATAHPRSVGLCGVVSAVASCPQLSNTVAGTETNNRDVFDHGSRKDLHHFHDFFHNLGTAEATRGVTTWITGEEHICTMPTISCTIRGQDGERQKLFVSLSARVEREQSTKTVRMEQYIKTHRHSNTQARATLGSRPSNRATQAPDLGQVTVQRQQLISATQSCGSHT